MSSNKRRLQCGVSAIYDSSRWIKLSAGLDDFRFGPPMRQAGRILPASPAIVREYYESPTPSPDTGSLITPTPPNLDKELKSASSLGSKISGYTASPSLYSRNSSHPPTPKIRALTKQKKHMKTIEKRLKANPLILFPYLESNIPHEVFVKLMNILGPTEAGVLSEVPTPLLSATDVKKNEDKLMHSRKLFSRKSVLKRLETREESVVAGAIEESVGQVTTPPVKKTLPQFLTDDLKKTNDEKTPKQTQSVSNPYRAFLKRMNYVSEKPMRKMKKKEQKPIPEVETNIRDVAEDFCKSIQAFDGQDTKPTMDVDKMLALFNMNPEKENLHTTINVLDDLPTTLEEAVEKTLRHKSITKAAAHPPPKRGKKTSKPRFVRYRYGAWYLDIDEWKKMKPNEKLEDPEEVAAREKQAAERSTKELDTRVSQLATYRGFLYYLRQNNLKTPDFLNSVDLPPVSSDNCCIKVGGALDSIDKE